MNLVICLLKKCGESLADFYFQTCRTNVVFLLKSILKLDVRFREPTEWKSCDFFFYSMSILVHFHWAPSHSKPCCHSASTLSFKSKRFAQEKVINWAADITYIPGRRSSVCQHTLWNWMKGKLTGLPHVSHIISQFNGLANDIKKVDYTHVCKLSNMLLLPKICPSQVCFYAVLFSYFQLRFYFHMLEEKIMKKKKTSKGPK